MKKKLAVAVDYSRATILCSMIWLSVIAIVNCFDDNAMPGAPGGLWVFLYGAVLAGSIWLHFTNRYAWLSGQANDDLKNLIVMLISLVLAGAGCVAVAFGVVTGLGAFALGLVAVVFMVPGALMLCLLAYMMGIR